MLAQMVTFTPIPPAPDYEFGWRARVDQGSFPTPSSISHRRNYANENSSDDAGEEVALEAFKVIGRDSSSLSFGGGGGRRASKVGRMRLQPPSCPPPTLDMSIKSDAPHKKRYPPFSAPFPFGAACMVSAPPIWSQMIVKGVAEMLLSRWTRALAIERERTKGSIR